MGCYSKVHTSGNAYGSLGGKARVRVTYEVVCIISATSHGIKAAFDVSSTTTWVCRSNDVNFLIPESNY